MGLHANLYLSASQSLAIENEAPPSLTTGALVSIQVMSGEQSSLLHVLEIR